MISRVPPNTPDARLLARPEPPRPPQEKLFGPMVAAQADEVGGDNPASMGAGPGDGQYAHAFNRDGFFGRAVPLDQAAPEAPDFPRAKEPSLGRPPAPDDLPGNAPVGDSVTETAGPQRPLPSKGSAPFAGQVPTYEHPIAYVRVVPEEQAAAQLAVSPAASSSANPAPSPVLGEISETLQTLAASLGDSSASPGAETPFALTLSQESTGLTVAVRTGAMEPEERERLERRIAGELARHGLIIHQIVLTAPPVDRDSPEER